MSSVGDKPLFNLTNHRFDKPAAYRLTQLLQETIMRHIGGVAGQAWGCLSTPDPTLRVVAGSPASVLLDIKTCILLASAPAVGVNYPDYTNGAREGRVVIHDTLRAAQTTSYVDLTALAPTALGGGGGAGGTNCWLLFRRQTAGVELDDAVYFDEVLVAEATAPTTLVDQEYVEFAAAATTPGVGSTYGENNGWFKFAYISSWADPAGPTVVPIQPVHARYLPTSTPPTTSGAQLAVAPTGLTSFEEGGTRGFRATTTVPSQYDLMHWVLLILSQHYSTASITRNADGSVVQPDSGSGWMAAPPRGLVEINDLLISFNATFLELNDRLLEAVADTISLEGVVDTTIRTLSRVLQVCTYEGNSKTWSTVVAGTLAGFNVVATTRSFKLDGVTALHQPLPNLQVTGLGTGAVIRAVAVHSAFTLKADGVGKFDSLLEGTEVPLLTWKAVGPPGGSVVMTGSTVVNYVLTPYHSGYSMGYGNELNFDTDGARTNITVIFYGTKA